jgi:hypothetical protein
MKKALSRPMQPKWYAFGHDLQKTHKQQISELIWINKISYLKTVIVNDYEILLNLVFSTLYNIL